MDWSLSAIIAAIALFVTIVGLVAAWAIRISRGERADSSATKAHGRIDTLAALLSEHQQRSSQELADFKERVARDYASNRMVEQMEGRIVVAIERLGDRLDRAFEGRKP